MTETRKRAGLKHKVSERVGFKKCPHESVCFTLIVSSLDTAESSQLKVIKMHTAGKS